MSKSEYRFEPVTDSRGRRLDRLWQRNGRFYCQLNLPGKGCRRVALSNEDQTPCRTPAEALDAAHRLRSTLKKGEMPAPGRTPLLRDYKEDYLQWIEQVIKKNPKTVISERGSLALWTRFCGGLRLSQITRKTIDEFVAARQKEVRKKPISNRTITINILALHNLLKRARSQGHLSGVLVTQHRDKLHHVPKKRELVTKAKFEGLIAELRRQEGGRPAYRMGDLVADYLLLMAYSGARKESAAHIRWEHVDFKRRQLQLLKTKYAKRLVVVDFNDQLEAHLKDLHSRRLPDSEFLFPSPNLTIEEAGRLVRPPICEVRGTLLPAAARAGLPHFRIHDLRHYFISWCVMSGVDYLTIAKWVGHEDGGVLIGKVYGHLNSEHTQAAAKKVQFAVAEPPPVSRSTAMSTGKLPLNATPEELETLARMLALLRTQPSSDAVPEPELARDQAA